MLKRMRKNTKGFTLMETLAVIGIIAVLAAIAIPNLISLKKSLDFKKVNNYAKEIFMAAQSNLTDRHATGSLNELRNIATDANTGYVGRYDNAGFPVADWSDEYKYTNGGRALNMILPAGSIDETVRSKNILIEYNPITGNVYSVFYSEKGDELSYGNVTRDETERREMMLGYYSGSGLSSESASVLVKDPIVELINDQEAYLQISVPIPEEYWASPLTFGNSLSVESTITGEMNGGSFTLTGTDFGEGTVAPDGKTILIRSQALDSLSDKSSFAGIKQNNPAGTARNTASIAKTNNLTGTFIIQPGENITVVTQITSTATVGSAPIEYNDFSIGGINPMFEALQKVTAQDGSTRCYDLYISNGRHLQNLNAISPLVAEQIRNIYISEDIYWNETVSYYNEKYNGGATYTNAGEEIPARGLPYFVPISNEYLFGCGKFSGSPLPAMNDTNDDPNRTATLEGGKKQIFYLNIDGNVTNIGKNYYAGNTDFGVDRFTGLISFADTTINGVYIVNPIVNGTGFSGNNNPATGALVGATGHSAFLYDCRVYIDRAAQYFPGPSGFDLYKVTGSGAVGGLVGYAKSHNTTNGELSQDSAKLAFSQCLAAIDVTGTMRSGNTYYWGYTNGVGGLVGESNLTNFYNCYATGEVRGTNAYAESGSALQRNRGVGGFVGTSHGTKYSNCFATGNVYGTSGATGSFLGTGIYNEGFNYANKRITQVTTFTSCYSAGVVNKTEGKNQTGMGKFSGYFKTGVSISGTNSTPAVENYYSNRNASSYLYKDSYYLNMIEQKNMPAESCAQLVQYSSLVDLPVYQNVLRVQNGVAAYADGFKITDWENATLSTTHPYRMDSAIYPFSKLVDMDYYGDWIPFDPSAGLAYYENYNSSSRSTANGNKQVGYYFDRDDVTEGNGNAGNMTLADNRVAYEDGYALLVNHDSDANGWPVNQMNIKVNDEAVPNPDNYIAKVSEPTVNGIKYHAYQFTPAFMNYLVEQVENDEATGADKFYVKVQVTLTFKYDSTITRWVEESYQPVGKNQRGYYDLVKEYRYNPNGTGKYDLTKPEHYVRQDRGGYNVTFTPYGTGSFDYDQRTQGWNTYYEYVGAGKGSYRIYNVTPKNNGAYALVNAEYTENQNGTGMYDYVESWEYRPGGDGHYNKIEGHWETETVKNTPVTFTMYFNPQFAMTQINPMMVDNRLQQDTPEPDTLPATIGVRTARQYRELTRASYFWGMDYHYIQEHNLDLGKSAYTWASYLGSGTDPDFTPIGTTGIPFEGSYSGAGGYVSSAKITNLFANLNLKRNANDTNVAYGAFGNIGATGYVHDLRLETVQATVPAAAVQAGLFAGYNAGKLEKLGIDSANASLTLSENSVLEYAGLMAGVNAGKVLENTLRITDTASLGAAKAAGGFIGQNLGAASEINKNTVDIHTASLSAGEYTGGIIGKMEEGTFGAENTVSVNTVEGKGIAGGFAGSFGGSIENTTFDIQTVTSNNIAAGFVGSIANAQVSNLTVNLGGTDSKISGTNGATGVFGNYSGVDISLLRANLNGSIQSDSGNAAGVLLNAGTGESHISHVLVNLGNQITAGQKAAGLAISVDKSMNDCHVYLSGSNAKIQGKIAAGLCNTFTNSSGANNVTMESCDVSGAGAISGTEKAAGLVNDIIGGSIQVSGVTPVLTSAQNKADAYHESDNGKLKVTSQGSAAGFANKVTGSVHNSYALGTVTGTNAAGFVNDNQSEIYGCEANVSVSSGSAFVQKNTGVITGCYVWYEGEPSKAFIEDNTDGKVIKSYAAALSKGSEAPFGNDAGEYDTCYNVRRNDAVSAITGVQNVSYETMALTKFVSAGTAWVTPAIGAYPYAEALTDVYPYPALRQIPQYGNWVETTAYSVGVAYFEKTGADIRYHVKEAAGSEASTLSTDGSKTVDSSGYAIFVHSPKQVPASINLEGKEELTISEEKIVLNNGTELLTADYHFYILSQDAVATGSMTDVVISWGDDLTSSFNPYFADTISAGSVRKISTSTQLQNIAKASSGSYQIVHSINMAGVDYTPIESFSGSLSCAENAVIQNLQQSLMKELSGSVSNTTVNGYSGTSGVFGTVDGGTIQNVTLKNAAVNRTLSSGGSVGILADEAANMTASGVQISNSSLTVDGSGTAVVGGIVGQMDGGSLTDSGTESLTLSYSGTAAKAMVGGIVGSTGGDAAFTGVHAKGSIAPAVSTDDCQVGKFAGYIENGTFNGCSAWQDGTLGFAGSVKAEFGETVDNAYTSAGTTDIERLVKENGSYQGFEWIPGGAQVQQIDASFVNCFYRSADGTREVVLKSDNLFSCNETSETYAEANASRLALTFTEVEADAYPTYQDILNGTIAYYAMKDDSFTKVSVVENEGTSSYVAAGESAVIEDLTQTANIKRLYTVSISQQGYVMLLNGSNLLKKNEQLISVEGAAGADQFVAVVEGDDAMERLQAMVWTGDGYTVAGADSTYTMEVVVVDNACCVKLKDAEGYVVLSDGEVTSGSVEDAAVFVPYKAPMADKQRICGAFTYVGRKDQITEPVRADITSAADVQTGTIQQSGSGSGTQPVSQPAPVSNPDVLTATAKSGKIACTIVNATNRLQVQAAAPAALLMQSEPESAANEPTNENQETEQGAAEPPAAEPAAGQE